MDMKILEQMLAESNNEAKEELEKKVMLPFPLIYVPCSWHMKLAHLYLLI